MIGGELIKKMIETTSGKNRRFTTLCNNIEKSSDKVLLVLLVDYYFRNYKLNSKIWQQLRDDFYTHYKPFIRQIKESGKVKKKKIQLGNRDQYLFDAVEQWKKRIIAEPSARRLAEKLAENVELGWSARTIEYKIGEILEDLTKYKK